jgi:methylthioribose-1-phosphate isomerase
MSADQSTIETLRWVGEPDNHLVIIDQTRLPTELVEIELPDSAAVWEAIKSLRIRGAPAIGITAAYGVYIGVQKVGDLDEDEFFQRLHEVSDYLATSRPTSVNLFWAIDRMKVVAEHHRGKGSATIAAALLAEAQAIHEEDRRICRAIGRYGAKLLENDSGVLTHCNAGGLATADYGTALAVFFAAQEEGKNLHIYADETRPLLQGARLTAWELQQRGIDVTLICDSMAAQVMREGRVQAVVTGADRIAANGDVANKIGTYQVALAAAAHDIPFYVAAPTSTFDLSLASGDQIPIEQRDPAEITHSFGQQTAPDGIQVYNPAFDVTPARLIRAIICEKGVIQPVSAASITALLADTPS